MGNTGTAKDQTTSCPETLLFAYIITNLKFREKEWKNWLQIMAACTFCGIMERSCLKSPFSSDAVQSANIIYPSSGQSLQEWKCNQLRSTCASTRSNQCICCLNEISSAPLSLQELKTESVTAFKDSYFGLNFSTVTLAFRCFCLKRHLSFQLFSTM